MGWLRWVGCFKSEVFCAKEPYKRDYILQTRPIILRSLLIIGTPYWKVSHVYCILLLHVMFLVAASLCVNTIVYLHMCVCAYARLLTHPQPHRHTLSCAYTTDTSTTPQFDTYTHSFLVWCVSFLLMCFACIVPSQSRRALASTCLSSLMGTAALYRVCSTGLRLT